MINRQTWISVACPVCGATVGTDCRWDGGAKPTPHRRRIQRAQEEADFWEYVDHQVRVTGRSEQQVLDDIRLPGWTRRKARTNPPAPRVIAMPVRDGRMAAAGPDAA